MKPVQRERRATWIARSAVYIAAGLLIPAIAVGSPASTALRLDGDEEAYNLRFDDALTRYKGAVAADADDPASYRAVAAVYMMKIAFGRGAITADDFIDGNFGGDTVKRPAPPSDLAGGFRTAIERALQLAERGVQARPQDAEAHYQLAATNALMASYAATIDGRMLGAFKLARVAYKEAEATLVLDPARQDAGFIIGIYQYVVSTRSFATRWVARMGGVDSNKQAGLARVETAFRNAGDKQTDGGLALVLIYNRERRYGDALNVLAQLRSRYPGNRLLWLESGSTAIRAGRFREATGLLDVGLGQLPHHRSTPAFGETALWHYKRGMSLVGDRRLPDMATTDLRTAISQEGREWVSGRAHTELGKLADLKGDREQARNEYRTAARIARSASDEMGQSEAERLLESGYR